MFSYAKQISLKNIVNTLYGVITSKYFDLNNVIVAENITSKTQKNVCIFLKCGVSILYLTYSSFTPHLTRLSLLLPSKKSRSSGIYVLFVLNNILITGTQRFYKFKR